MTAKANEKIDKKNKRQTTNDWRLNNSCDHRVSTIFGISILAQRENSHATSQFQWKYSGLTSKLRISTWKIPDQQLSVKPWSKLPLSSIVNLPFKIIDYFPPQIFIHGQRVHCFRVVLIFPDFFSSAISEPPWNLRFCKFLPMRNSSSRVEIQSICTKSFSLTLKTFTKQLKPGSEASFAFIAKLLMTQNANKNIVEEICV